MPGRTTALVNDEFYHIYNRGSERRDIFSQPRNYERFIKTIFYYQFSGPKPSFSKFTKSKLIKFEPLNENKIVDIICYCLMPNHFHFLIRQLKENGISTFMSQISNSYTKYFNTKYQRVGALLQGTFKSVHVETDAQFVHLSRYIHLNPIVSDLVKELDSYKWSSYLEFLNGKGIFCSVSEVLNLFPRGDYKEFVEAQVEHGISLEILKHRAIDYDDH